MKFKISKDYILPALQKLTRVIENRNTMPILGHIKFDLIDGELTLTGTDLEIQIVANLKVDCEDTGSFTVPAKKLLSIVSLLPPESTVTFTKKEDKVSVVSGRSRFSLSTLDSDDYPDFSSTNLINSISIDATDLSRALDKTMFCMANNDVRFYLNGLSVKVDNNNLKFVGSDGHRLAIYDIKVDSPLDENIIIPRKAILELHKLIQSASGNIEIYFTSNYLKTVVGDIEFSSKLVDAKFPDFSKALMQSFRKTVDINTLSHKEALDRVSILANEKFKGVSMLFEHNELKLTSNNPEHDEAEEFIKADYDANEPFNLGFNASYLLDAISHYDNEVLPLKVAANDSLAMIEGEGFTFIVMPMRL